MSVTREDLNHVVEKIYGRNYNITCYAAFLDDVELGGPTKRFSVFCTIGESVGNGDVLILDNETYNFISWYKLSHIGRDLHTNINRIFDLEEFIQAFYNLCREEDEYL